MRWDHAVVVLALLILASATVGCRDDGDQARAATPRPLRTAPAPAPSPPPPPATPLDAGLSLPSLPPSATAAALHQRAIVVDLHNDVLWQMRKADFDFGRPPASIAGGLANMRAGGLDVQVFSLYLNPSRTPDPTAAVREQLARYRQAVVGASPEIVHARTARVAARAVARGKRVAMLGLEGAFALAADEKLLDQLAEQGLAYVGLTWNEDNPFATGAKTKADTGLTERGRALVARLNELRIPIDVSHASDATFWDVVTASRRPVIASHSNARRVCDHRRNLDDLQLWAIARSGGVVGLNFHASFVRESGAVTTADLLAHAEVMQAIGGDGLLALGSDFDGDIEEPTDLVTVAALPHLTQGLVDRGWKPDALAGALGHNALRALESVQTGPLERRVTHRPAKAKVTGSGKHLRATDHDLSRPWLGRGQGGMLRVLPRERGADRIALWRTLGEADGPPLEVIVRALVDGEWKVNQLAVVGHGAQPSHVDLGPARCAKRVEIEVEIVKAKGEPEASLSEVTLEVDPTASSCP